MKDEPKIPLAGSQKPAMEGYQPAAINKKQQIEITIRLRRKRPLPLNNPPLITREEYEQQTEPAPTMPTL